MSLLSRFVSGGAFLVVVSLMVAPAQADVNPHEKLKQHVRDVVTSVKAAPTADEKRSILDEELRNMITVLNRTEKRADLSPKDQSAINALRAQLQEKVDELHGQNGYDAVPDRQLDSFANYVQQDIEQADTLVTISVTTALVLLLLIILLL